MALTHIILPILVGAVIGYFTNYIAIKMLFHPHKAVYIGKWQLPFTPGIIPNNQKRLAHAIGEAVSKQLLTKEAVLENLKDPLDRFISDFTAEICKSDTKIKELFSEESTSDELIESASDALAESILEKAGQVDLDSVIAQFGQEAVNSFLGSHPMLAMLIGENAQNAICSQLAGVVREYLDKHGEETIKGFAKNYMRDLADKPVSTLVQKISDQERLQAALHDVIHNVVSKHGASLLDQIDIAVIVAQKIEAMDVNELENLVLSVMKQELQAIVNLGALIGAVIGTINIFFR